MKTSDTESLPDSKKETISDTIGFVRMEPKASVLAKFLSEDCLLVNFFFFQTFGPQ